MNFKKTFYLFLIFSVYTESCLVQARIKFLPKPKALKVKKKSFKAHLAAGLLSVSSGNPVIFLSKEAHASLTELNQLEKHKRIKEFFYLNPELRSDVQEFNFHTQRHGSGSFALISIIEKDQLDVLKFYIKNFDLSYSLNLFSEEISLLHLSLFLGKKDISFYLMKNQASLVNQSNYQSLSPIDMLFLDEYPLQTDRKIIYHLSARSGDLRSKKHLKEFFKKKYPELFLFSEKKMKKFKIKD